MGLHIILARHGETRDNARRVFQGHAGSGLNGLGRAQATRLGERMRRAPPTAIVASDLERAVETARIVSDACGVPVELERGLREVDVGTWTGRSYDEVAELYPEEWAAWQSGLDIRRGGGETYAELAERVDGAIRSIVSRHDGDPGGEPVREARPRVLVVSHGMAIKCWVARLLGVTAGALRALGPVANAALTVVERDTRARHRLHSWNDTAHLEDLAVEGHSE